MNWQIDGFSELGVCVEEPDYWVDFFRDIGGWEVLWTGENHPSSQSHWPITRHRLMKETLLEAPGSSSGRIRLFHDVDGDSPNIHLGNRVVDSGGIYDFDVRTSDLMSIRQRMLSSGWVAVSDPIEWSVGDSRVLEWLAVGPHQIVTAIVQRLDPPLADPPAAGGFGSAFNSTQVVQDLHQSGAFYRSLGFSPIFEHHGPLPGRGGEVLGLSAHEAPQTPVDMIILSVNGELDGSVELIRLPNHAGRNEQSRALPNNRGLNLLRFPVSGLSALAEHAQKSGLAERALVHESELAPYGTAQHLNLVSPDGAWLEFYELVS